VVGHWKVLEANIKPRWESFALILPNELVQYLSYNLDL